MVKLIVVGDPHIRPGSSSRAVDTAEHLAQLVGHVNSHHPDAAYCLFLGDLTHEGEPEAYARFRDLITPLQMPPLLMIGNHDVRAHFQQAFPEAPQDAHGFVQFTQDLGPDHRLIALDSLNGPPYDTIERHAGFLDEARLAFLESELAAAGDRDILLAVHHQPFRIGLPGMDVIRLLNGEAFMALVSRFPSVKMLLLGHNHRSIAGQVRGLTFNGFKSLDTQTPLDFESLDPSSGIAEPPNYGVLLLSEDSILVHHEDFTSSAEPESTWQQMLAVNPGVLALLRPLVEKMMPERLAELDAFQAHHSD
jgi:3',5'-cyclic AMP phosphodiesterase CpdA